MDLAAPTIDQATDPAWLIARLERVPSSRIHSRARLIVGCATFFDAYEAISVAYAMPSIMREWHMAPQLIGLVIGAAYFGQLFGAILFGWLAERIGRLRVATYTVAVFAVMSIVCTFAWSGPSLALFRFIQGIGIGGEVPVAGTYISELTGARSRGRVFLLYAMIFPVGLVAAGATGYLLVPYFGWRTMFYVGALPAFLIVVARRFLPESPRWLISQGRVGEAEIIISRIEADARSTGQVLATPNPIPLSDAAKRGTRWLELLSPFYLRRTLLSWGLWICTYLIINGLTTWLPTIYSSIFHLPVGTSIALGLLTNACSLVGTFTAAMLIDRVGRRRWYLGSFIISAVPLAILYAIGATSALEVAALATAGYFFIGTVGTSLYLYTAELYPTRMRAAGTSVASGWARAASAASPALVGIIIQAQGISLVFGCLALVSVAGAVVCVVFAIETSGRVLEDLSP